MLAALTLTTSAQQTTTPQNQKELNKEITLEKDFVPEIKKATKKNTLPAVKKVTPPAKTDVSYSNWANPIDVQPTIPTMMPYGYRTAHNFSDKRGYLAVGGGMAANFIGSAGYRFIDKDNLTLGAWLQHNSTWAGKNSSQMILNDNLRLKQKFNDNLVGVDLMNRFKVGTLTLNARGHFDSFNYYGGINEAWDDDHKQTFTEFGLKGAWEALPLDVNDHEVTYNVGLAFNHAGYEKTLVENVKGAKQNTLNFTLGGEYAINEYTAAGLQIEGDYVNTNVFGSSNNYFIVTLSPYFSWENSVISAQLGADILLGKPMLYDFSGKHKDGIDGRRVLVSPNVNLDFNFSPGAKFYVSISGGKILNTLSDMAAQNRYSDPTASYPNSFSPFDGEAGFKIGPFSGFNMKLFGGYGFFEGDLNGLVIPSAPYGGASEVVLPYTLATNYIPIKAKGMKIGADLNYKYRSLVEANASIIYAPAGDDVKENGWTQGYSLDGFEGASLVSKINLQVKPLRQLTLDLGLDLYTDRAHVIKEFIPTISDDEDAEPIATEEMPYTLDWYDLDDIINLHAGASWRFDKVVTLWVKGNNLLNRKWDVMPGMGAQKFNVMGGVSLVF